MFWKGGGLYKVTTLVHGFVGPMGKISLRLESGQMLLGTKQSLDERVTPFVC